MAEMSREQLEALGKAGLEYQRLEFNRDHWLDRLESWLLDLSRRPSAS
jgi:hypothetical protein